MDVTALLARHGDDAPSGENLEYDPAFTDLELAAAPGQERQAGDEILPADDPDWPDVRDKALAVLARSHDLRAACHLAPALLATEGLAGLAQATAYIRGCLEDHWDSCHPQLDADDDNDPTMRVNAVQNLSPPPGSQSGEPPLLRLLRLTPLSDSRGFGRFSLRDIQYANGEVPPPDGVQAPDPAAIAAAFKDTDPATLSQRLDMAQRALDNVTAIETKFGAETHGRGPNLDVLVKTLKQVVRQLSDHGSVASADARDDGADDRASGAVHGSGGQAAVSHAGAISSSRDVIAMLDRILAFYEQHEPSSPLPIILKRARRLVGADFMTIMHDLAPQGMDNVRTISGESDDG